MASKAGTPQAVAAKLVTSVKGAVVKHVAATEKRREAYTVLVNRKRVAELLVNRTCVRLNIDVALPGKAIPAGVTTTYVPKKDAKLVWAGGAFDITEANAAEALAEQLDALYRAEPAQQPNNVVQLRL